MKYKFLFLSLIIVWSTGCYGVVHTRHEPVQVEVQTVRQVVVHTPPVVRYHYHRPIVRTVYHHHSPRVVRHSHHHHRRTTARPNHHHRRTHSHHHRRPRRR